MSSNAIKLSLAIIIFSCSSLRAQTTLSSTPDSYISISGTSTLHPWTMTSNKVVVKANIEFGADTYLQSIKDLQFSAESTSLQSGNAAMDKNAHSALDTEVHKKIIFSLISARINKNKILCTGTLSISGVSKSITLETTYKKIDSQNLLCTGKKEIRMSDYGVEPPSFMFGTVKTGDEIVVSFNIQLSSERK